jgi:hypothetical protein
MPRPTEAEPGSTFGIGRAVPDREFDGWASANTESSPISISAGSDDVGTESDVPPLSGAPLPSAALAGALIVILLTLWTLAARAYCSGKCHRLPPSRFARLRMVHVSTSVPKRRQVQSKPQLRDQSRYSMPPSIYISRSPRKRTTEIPGRLKRHSGV